jgi:hypothetical protein
MPPASQELDAVVRWVEDGVAADPSCQVLVPIDRRTGQPGRGGLWNRKHRRSMLVTNSHRAAAIALRKGLRISTGDFARGLRFEMILDYEAKCTPGREVRVAQALWQGASPQERLEELIEKWVIDRLDGRVAEFLSDFDRQAPDLGGELRARAAQETGLTLSVRVSLEDAGRPDALRIGPVKLTVSVRDRDEELQVQLEAELGAQPGRERIAFLYRDREESLRRAVLIQVSEYFAGGVTSHQFHTELADRVRDELLQRLDSLLAPYGRRVVRLSLRDETGPEDKQASARSRRFEHQFPQRLGDDYPEPVQVRTEVLLELVDRGRYERAQSPDLKKWAAAEVEDAVTRSLFGVTYTDLCQSYEEKKAEVERRMKARAATIGYDLKQLVTITDLQLDVLRRPFPVAFKDEFATSEAKLSVGLEVNVSVVVPHPAQIASLLDRRVDVKQQIRGTLLERVRQELHQISPESFYMEFEKSTHGEAVRDRLAVVISKTLRDDYHAEALALSCKQLDTDLSRLLARLIEQLHPLNLEVEIELGGPAVKFEGSFRVLGVDPQGWYDFQSKRPESEDLCKSGGSHLLQLLADVSAATLIQTLNADWRAVANKALQSRMQQEFGLKVQLMDWRRHALPVDPRQVEVESMTAAIAAEKERIAVRSRILKSRSGQLEAAEDRRQKELGELQGRLRRLQQDGGSPEEQKELREKIARAQEEVARALEDLMTERPGAVVRRLHSAVRGFLPEAAAYAPPSPAGPEEPAAKPPGGAAPAPGEAPPGAGAPPSGEEPAIG